MTTPKPNPVPEGDWAALNALLAKYATTVNNLRRRVEALESQPVSDTSDTPAPAGPPAGPAGPGVWVMKPTCLSCKKDKGPGREENLTCKPCGKIYMDGVRDPSKRTMVTTCGYCGSPKSPNLSPQCTTCQQGFTHWKKAPR